MIFGVLLVLEIAFSLINFILIGVSICNTEQMAVAGIMSSLAILIINAGTLVASIVYFLAKTKVATGQVAAEMRPLSDNSRDVTRQQDQSQRPAAKPKQEVEDVEEE